MKIIEEVEVQFDFADLLARVPLDRRDKDQSRAPGIHLSGVLRHTARQMRIKGWEKYERETEIEDPKLGPRKYPLIWAMGVMWEEFVASMYVDWNWQPGECLMETSQGPIAMNCDGHSLLVGEGLGFCIEEAKYTSQKRKTWLEFSQDWLKMQQGLGYCAGYADGETFRLVRWHVLWNNQPWAPCYMRYLVQFSDDDVESTRTILTANRQGAIDAGYGE